MASRSAARVRFAAALALLGATIGFGACAEILGVDGEFEDVVQAFCKCDGLDERWSRDFTGNEYFTCEEWVTGRFEARPDLVTGWLDTFDEAGCHQCSAAEACASAAPLCVEEGEPCISDDSCCGYSADFPTKAYCGLALVGPEQVEPRCFADPDYDTCTGPGEPCSANEDCCGDEGLASSCPVEAGIEQCVVSCDPVNDAACPGCCAIVRFDLDSEPDEVGGVCLGSLPWEMAPSCDDLCVGSCGIGYGCSPTFYPLAEPSQLPGLYVNACVPIISP